jgi:hypothetical protein
VGVLVGVLVGVSVGVLVGVSVGVLVGVSVGVLVGVSVGVLVGVLVGVSVGVLVAVLVGVSVGTLVGVSVGKSVGVLVGISVGVLVRRNRCVRRRHGCVGVCSGRAVRIGWPGRIARWWTLETCYITTTSNAPGLPIDVFNADKKIRTRREQLQQARMIEP